MRKISFIIALFFILSTGQTNASNQGIFNLNNAKNQSVEDLPDAQIENLVKKMQEQGVSTEQAIAIARAKGASELQIQQLIKRIEEIKNSSNRDTIKDTPNPNKQKVEFSKKEAIEESQESKQVFGFQFFNTQNLNFASNLNTPLSEDYVIGVGDNIQINVYGASQQDYTLTVNTNRAIKIPNIGPVYIGGISFSEAKKIIKARLSSIYGGMKGRNPNTFASINIGDISGINVNVIGEANKPGTYTLPATASVFNALYLAGGPGENGSFRQIEIVRKGETIAEVDVYDYLIKGDTRNNIQLSNNDVILVKPYINRVFISGAFKRTGIFEAKAGETLADIIRYAGGFTTDAYSKQISLSRNNSRTLSFKTVTENQFELTPILNGDKIEAGKVVDFYENRVSIHGAIYRPGNYELSENLTLKQLIEKAEGLKDDAFLDRAIITRKLDNFELQTLSFSLKDILDGSENIVLKREDNILISSIFDMREKQTIRILGEVQFPGTFSYTENMTVADLIFLAGGFNEKASISNIEIARRLNYDEAENYTDNLIHTYTLSVDRNLKLSNQDAKMTLMPFDYVYVRNAPGYNQGQGSINISGEVKYAGDYGIALKQERISDLIERAGGFTPEAYPEGISLQRKEILSDAQYQSRLQLARQDSTMNEADVKKEEYQIVAINLKEILSKKGSNDDLILKDGDRIFVPAKMQTVTVSGAVLNPVAITYDKRLTARDYINLSGGFSSNAKKSKVYVVYPNGEAHARKGFIFKSSPKVIPGSEIIVPEKPQIDKTAQAQRWIGMGSGIAGIVASIAAIISISKR